MTVLRKKPSKGYSTRKQADKPPKADAKKKRHGLP